MRHTMSWLVLAVVLLAPARPAEAQRFPFDRTYQTPSPATLDVLTSNGKIEVVAGEPGRIEVSGEATVRVGWNVPANAVDLARAVAEHPPVQQDGSTVRLRLPQAADSQRAIVLSYRVRVPPDTRVMARSESGATSVQDVGGVVDVRTQSASIDLMSLGGDVTVQTGSGTVTLDGAAGATRVRTGSSSVSLRGIGGSLMVRTSSGSVQATMTGDGDADIETGSSSIDLSGATRGVTLTTRSGRITVAGRPGQAWTVSTGSAAIDVAVPADAAFTLDATSRSGDVTVDGASPAAMSKGKAAGPIGGGGPTVRLSTRSGAVHVRVGS